MLQRERGGLSQSLRQQRFDFDQTTLQRLEIPRGLDFQFTPLPLGRGPREAIGASSPT
jgi:hypothetical protein